MDERVEHTRLRDALLRLRDVTLTLPDGTGMGPITWEVLRGRRICVSCASDAQWDALVALLTGQLQPASGGLQEIVPVKVQTDVHLRDTLDLNQSIRDYLHSPDAPEYVWLDRRRRALWVLIDLLGISPDMTRRPLKMEGATVYDKYWALRFMLSRAELLIGREIFQIEDARVRTAFRSRWHDFPGTLIVGDLGATLPGPCDTRVRIDAVGSCSIAG